MNNRIKVGALVLAALVLAIVWFSGLFQSVDKTLADGATERSEARLFSSGMMQDAPVVAVTGLWHESNSFSTQLAGLEEFDGRFDEDQEERTRRFFNSDPDTRHGGYIAAAEKYGLQLYPGFLSGARPRGPVTDEAFETMMEKLLDDLHEGPELSGIILHLHGAMVVESFPSGDAEITRRVREAFGPEMPIVVTHDYHANIAPSIIEDSDVLITFKENPHIDTYDRGYQAAEIMAKMIAGEVNPTQAYVKPPMVYNIVYQSTFNEPFLSITNESKRMEKNDKVLAVSASGGYQYADVPEMGPTAVVVTDNDPELAQSEAQRLADMIWETRHETVLDQPSPAEAVKMAMEHDGRPVLLIDMGDNIGGGSTGDSTFLLKELLNQNAQGWVMVISDPEAYDVAEQAGIGGEFDFEVGGKTDDQHGDPVRIKGHVRSLNVGRYYEPEVRHGGTAHWDMSHTAVIHLDGSSLAEPNLVLITQTPSSPNSEHQLTSNGVYIHRQKIIVAKGAIAPRAAYEPITDLMIPVDSPGATAVNPDHFVYRNVRSGVWGINEAQTSN